MEEISGIVSPSKEIAPPLLDFNKIEANSYWTKSISEISVNGVLGQWHLVKGSARTPEEAAPGDQIKYEVFFDPSTNTWLKIIPPEAINDPRYGEFEGRLRKSALQQKMALLVAGLPELAGQVNEAEVEIGGKRVYGFTTPHIGPSLEHLIFSLTGKRKSKDLPPRVGGLLSDVYSIAADQAEKLYLQFGIWTTDLNPGNILLRFDENGVHVVLIDFSNKIQEFEHLFANLPTRKFSGENYVKKVKSLLLGNVHQIHERFKRYTGEHGIAFSRDAREVEQNIEQSVAVINARKSHLEPTIAS